METHVTVAGDADIEETRKVLVDAVKAQDWVMKDMSVEALLVQIADSGLMFRVRCWIETFEETRRVEDKLNTVVVEALTEAGIEMPYPTYDVNLKGGLLHVGDREVV